LGERIDDGIILTKDGHATDPPPQWRAFEASHPVPDSRGERATQVIIDELETLKAGDVAIVLISGGGSALFEAPRPPLGLEDIQETTRLLLRAGAPIHHLNAVRSELSLVKGGGLRRTIGEATCVSIILSDVLGNDPTVIASGPTIEREPDRQTAIDLLEVYGLIDSVPTPVLAMLKSPVETLALPDTTRDVYAVIGDNDRFIDEIARRAETDGFRAEIVLCQVEGEARELASTFIEAVSARPEGVGVMIGGGEATVTVLGEGSGGRNTEFALAAAVILNDTGSNLVVASLASDGQDGAIDASGAIVDQYTIEGGAALGLDAASFLDNNDSGSYLDRVGALIRTGPTGTNVNDVYIAMKVDAAE
jgi:hydroxypyruvate reductase